MFILKKIIQFGFFVLIVIELISCGEKKQNLELVPYRKANKWGFSDLSRNIIIKPQYDEVTFFRKGISFVRVGELLGMIDTEGENIIDIKYDRLEASDEGFIFCSGTSRYLFNLEGKELVEEKQKRLGRWIEAKNFGENLVSIYDMEDGYKFIDLNGKTIVYLGFKYEPKTPFINGFAVVADKTSKHYSIIDKNGKVIRNINLTYEWLTNFDPLGKNFIKVSESWEEEGIINNYGDFILPINNWKIDYAENENIFIVNYKNKYGTFSSSGDMVIPIVYGHIGIDDIGNGLIRLTKNNKCYLSDINGQILTRQGYDFIASYRSYDIFTSYSTTKDELIRVRFGDSFSGKRGFINRNGKLVIPVKYDDAKDFSNKRAGVKKDDKWGFINENDSLIIGYQYDAIMKGFINGRAIVKSNNKWLIIDTSGTPIITKRFYDSIFNLNENGFSVSGEYDKLLFMTTRFKRKYESSPSQKFYKVELNGKVGLIDTEGNEYFE